MSQKRIKSEIHYSINGEKKTVTYKGGLEMSMGLAVVVIFRIHFGVQYTEKRVQAEEELEKNGQVDFQGIFICGIKFEKISEIDVSLSELTRIDIRSKDRIKKGLIETKRLKKKRKRLEKKLQVV